MTTNQKFIESICFQRGDYQLIDYHQDRIDRTFKKFYPNASPLKLVNILPKLDSEERHKVRILYSEELVDVEYAEYVPSQIQTLKVVEDNTIDYLYKSEDRNQLTHLYQQRGKNDDIIILKNQKVTDSYYANLAFSDGEKWFTPQTHLLPGVKRQYLIDQNLLHERDISLLDIHRYKYVSPINAMLDPGEIKVPVVNIML